MNGDKEQRPMIQAANLTPLDPDNRLIQAPNLRPHDPDNQLPTGTDLKKFLIGEQAAPLV